MRRSKHAVRLDEEERERLQRLIRGGKSPGSCDDPGKDSTQKR